MDSSLSLILAGEELDTFVHHSCGCFAEFSELGRALLNIALVHQRVHFLLICPENVLVAAAEVGVDLAGQ